MSVTPNGLVHPAAELFPMLPTEELQALADDISTNGLLEPIVLLPDGTLLDGRNRLAACELCGVEPTFTVYRGDEPWSFVVSLNIERRHLTTGQRAMIGVKALPMLEAEAKERMLAGVADPGADRPQGSEPPQRTPRSRDRAAKTAHTSAKAVARAKRVTEKAPDLAERVQAGTLALDRAERIVRDREAEAKRVEDAKRHREEAPASYRIDIRHGDFREVLADLTDIDAIITDPPYPAEYLPLLDDLAAWADKILKPDGILAVLFGQTHLPEVYRRLDGHRPYRWTGCYLTPGAGYVSHPRRVSSNWKPILVYGGGPRFADTLDSRGTDAAAKNMHEWGQDYGAFHTLVERLTQPNQTVVDPFMGSGTTLLAANALGRHAIGCDTNPEHVATAKERLS